MKIFCINESEQTAKFSIKYKEYMSVWLRSLSVYNTILSYTYTWMKDNYETLYLIQKLQRGPEVWSSNSLPFLNLYSHYYCKPPSDLIIQLPGLLADSMHIYTFDSNFMTKV